MSQEPETASAPPLAAPSPSPAAPSNVGRRSRFLSAGFLIALAVYVASRFYFGFVFEAGTTDVLVYFDYAVQAIDLGQTPFSQKGSPSPHYRNLQNLEYPPVGYWVTALPRRLPHQTLPRGPEELNVDGLTVFVEDENRTLTPDETREFEFQRRRTEEYWTYAARFRVLMLLFDIGSFALFCALLLRRRPDFLVWGMWGYTVTTSLLGYVMFERFDMAVTFSFMAWAYCWLRAGESDSKTWAWSAAAYTALGLGISLKLIPVIVVPFALLCDLYALAKSPRRWSLLVGPAMLVVAAVGPFAYYYALVGDDLKGMFRYHMARGIQIESTYATLMMLLQPAKDLYCYFDFGSWNLGGSLAEPMLEASSWILIAVLAGLGLRAVLAPKLGEPYDRVASYRISCVVVPVATVTAKVFSLQYLLWALPLALLGAAELFSRRAFIVTVLLAIVVCACTGFLYPYHYIDQMPIYPYTWDNPPPWALITITAPGRGELDTGIVRATMIMRNLAYAGLCAALYVMVLRRTRPTLLPRGEGGGVLADG